MFAYGACALILALYLSELGHSDSRIGLFMTLTLLGDVAISLLLTLVADGLGRRRILLFGCVMMVLAGVTFASTGNYWILLAAAIIGIISPSGNEIGPFRAVEESTLAQLVEKPEQRPDVFAWYVVLAQVGTCLGLFICGWIVDVLKKKGHRNEVDAFRAAFWLYAGVGLVKCLLVLCLSSNCEVHKEEEQEAPNAVESEAEDSGTSNADTRALLDGSDDSSLPKAKKTTSPVGALSRGTIYILLRICLLFSIDSLASGMVPFSLINYYLDRKFHLDKSVLGSIMSASWFCGAVFNIFAASLAKRIGLVKTMVFTHLPSAIFLGLLPAPTSLLFTIILLVARACLSSMDQAPRSAFLSAIVKPSERTAVMGIVNVVKTLSQSGGPVITGVLSQSGRFWIAFVVAGAMKATYDVGLLAMFLNVKLHAHESGEQANDGDREESVDESTSLLAGQNREDATEARNERRTR